MFALKRYYPLHLTQIFKNLYRGFKKESMLFRLSILDVSLNYEDKVILNVSVKGIKNQIIKYTPEEIVFNDHLLMEFSPCDVRSITYLSFAKHINFSTELPLIIKSQNFKKGKTVFIFFNKFTKEQFERNAIEAYQDYNLLNQLNKRDMINVVSTAVQEQSFNDFSNMR
jgi:hypothetical protein